MPKENEIIKLIAEELPRTELIYLFGSRAKGQARAESDYDLAFKSDTVYSGEQVFQVAQKLSNLLNSDVHLIDLRTATSVLKAQILGNKKALFSCNESKRHEFEMYALSEYARLNEERKLLLEKFYTTK